MFARRFVLAGVVVGTCLHGAPVAGADPAAEAVPARTAFSVRTPLGGWGTETENLPRAALSLAKLYLADYAVRHGDGSPADLAAAERAIRRSDDAAADTLGARYPQAVAATAAEFGLTRTGGGYWGTATTSTADVATFLLAKETADPGSPILLWMATAAPVAADGTPQDWGTADVPGVIGTKWGWSDTGVAEVASASFGPGFVVVAHTTGSTGEHTADVFAGIAAAVADTVLPG
ncbi:hypothetical protein [Nocardia asteroides]|uniref:hypothetical protein n=1 Tax=Nocardia asteroides TaxID=1824 RepID=UPI001E4C36C7|nr:hypothetical protein [Nocardia asteroides]UGT62135.1 hypothetical protein LTT61_01925 [Nocardia asteroides]